MMNERTPKNMKKLIRVLLISKFQIVRDSLKFLIESDRDLTVAGTHSFAENIGKSTSIVRSDVAVVYFSSGDRVEIVSDLLQRMPGLRVVVIIEGTDLDTQAHALKLGAVGIVQKEHSPKLLIEAIKQTHAGDTWLNQVLLNKILERGKSNGKKSTKFLLQSDTDSLTARELEVIDMVGEGLKNKNIAERLFISEATVRHHLSSIYGKIGVADRQNLVIFAYQNGLIELSDAPGETA
jgi:two-component system, NarL family, nitrate/nitrite response regulator NarL